VFQGPLHYGLAELLVQKVEDLVGTFDSVSCLADLTGRAVTLVSAAGLEGNDSRRSFLLNSLGDDG